MMLAVWLVATATCASCIYLPSHQKSSILLRLTGTGVFNKHKYQTKTHHPNLQFNQYTYLYIHILLLVHTYYDASRFFFVRPVFSYNIVRQSKYFVWCILTIKLQLKIIKKKSKIFLQSIHVCKLSINAHSVIYCTI